MSYEEEIYGQLPFFQRARTHFLREVYARLLSIDGNNVPSNADKGNRYSVSIAYGIWEILGIQLGNSSDRVSERLAGQKLGIEFERVVISYIQSTFSQLPHLRPGRWVFEHIGNRSALSLSSYEQYKHLHTLSQIATQNPELMSSIGNDYSISPDILVARLPVSDEEINAENFLVDDGLVANRSGLRERNSPHPILHASISTKWTLRSDRSQNARAEALNMIRNRKGRLPHIVVVTAEPLPSRLSSIALGTGDIDCVYHFALHELLTVVSESGNSEAIDLLQIMVNGDRLKDISDLPLDLAI